MRGDKRVEAALFSAGRPVTVAELAKATGLERETVRNSLSELIKWYKKADTALEVSKAGDKYAMQVKKTFTKTAMKLTPTDIPKPLIKTLSLIAYYQPMKQRQLLDMLGNKAYRHIKELERLGLIKPGRAGRYKVLITTKKFPEYFGLESTDRNEIKKILAKHAGVTSSGDR